MVVTIAIGGWRQIRVSTAIDAGDTFGVFVQRHVGFKGLIFPQRPIASNVADSLLRAAQVAVGDLIRKFAPGVRIPGGWVLQKEIGGVGGVDFFVAVYVDAVTFEEMRQLLGAVRVFFEQRRERGWGEIYSQILVEGRVVGVFQVVVKNNLGSGVEANVSRQAIEVL